MKKENKKIIIPFILCCIIIVLIIGIIISLYCMSNSIEPGINEELIPDLTDLDKKYGISIEAARELYNLPDCDFDIEELQHINQDIYSYIYIPSVDISSPVMQHPEDITYYFSHTYDGSEDSKGGVFTQFMNQKDYTDNNTVIFGRNENDGPFKNLDLYHDAIFFRENPYVYLFSSDRTYIYQLYASYEFDDRHLLMYYKVNDINMFQNYLDEIADYTTMSGNINKDIWPNSNDKIITLETDVIGKSDKRYLVQAKLVGITFN